jgi:5-methylcytosine-specific restriction enzyme subunit McrC
MHAASPARTVVLTERVPHLCRLAPADVEFLLQHHRGRIEVVPTGRRRCYRLTSAGYAGVLVAPTCRLVIRPKVPLDNLFALLDPAAPLPSADDRITPVPGAETLEFLAARLAQRMAERAAAGLHRAYAERAEQGPFLQGRLDLPAQLREAPGRKEQLHCLRDDLTADVPYNQVPKATAERLLSSPLVGEAVRAELRQALASFATVSPVAVGAEALSGLSAPEAYRPLLDLCGLLLAGLAPGEAAGAVGAPAFLLDMEQAFEGYLTRGVVSAFARSRRFTVAAQAAHTVNRPAPGQPDVSMRPDLLIGMDGKQVVAVDAKWKRPPKGALVTADLYQVLAYCTALGLGRGVLVYPGRRDRAWEYEFPHTPIRVAVHTLRVAGPREACARSLRRLARSLRPEGGP